MDEDEKQEWIIVKKSKRKLIQKDIKPQKIHMKGGSPSYDRTLHTDIQQQFKIHPNITQNIQILSNFFKNIKFKQVHITCLGLGNFSQFLKPQLQLQFLKICILNQLKQLNISHTINIYDPIFSTQQKQEINKLNASCNQLQNLQQDITHIIYMPHCDRFLYEKVCELKVISKNIQIIVIGNSINDYKQRCRLINAQTPQIFIPFIPIDIKIKDYKQAFNDTFIYIL